MFHHACEIERCQAIFLVLASSHPVANYPDPQSAAYNKCRIPKRGHLCDPEGMLSDWERERLFEIVEKFPNMTKNPSGTTDWKRQGVFVGIALAKWDYNTVTLQVTAKKLALDWLQSHSGDKFIMILVHSELKRPFVWRPLLVPLMEGEIKHLLHMESDLWKTGKYYEGLVALLDGFQKIIAFFGSILASILLIIIYHWLIVREHDEALPIPPPQNVLMVEGEFPAPPPPPAQNVMVEEVQPPAAWRLPPPQSILLHGIYGDVAVPMPMVDCELGGPPTQV